MHKTQDLQRPDVPLPAPVYFALFIAAGLGLSRVAPMWLPDMQALFIGGWVLNAIATLLLLWCFALFLRNRTTIMPRNPVSTLVAQGPYRISRNPMYLSLGLFHLGIALNTGNVWHFLSFFPHMMAISRLVIKPEEAYMQARFGDAYCAYCEKVRRWI